MADPWQVAEPLAAAGVDVDWIRRVAELAGSATGAAMLWIAATLSARRLAAELEERPGAWRRWSGRSSRTRTLDRGDLVEVDLHEGVETTLTVLGHKLKHTAIGVERDYDRSLPKLTARAVQLNQVWTNLLDNAIDALGDSGTITITTCRDGDCAVVAIADDGPGIPPDDRDHVFDPFFTTKDVGRGTGLGLSTARRIVVSHQGSLTLDPARRGTSFSVRLPLART